jgi:hypothetical protein
VLHGLDGTVRMQIVHLSLLVLPILSAAPSDSAGEAFEAKGRADVVFRAPASGMYRVQVHGDAGTSCTIADHLRGPFARAGEPGKKNCDLDVMLDAGLYKVRLTSPAQGKGRARLLASPFVDVQAPVKLEEGRQLEARLRPGEQLSAWLQIEERQSVTLEVAGRTAGRVSLWRDGRWLEEISFVGQTVAPRAGKEIHRWRTDTILEPGEYKLVVYGTNAKAWTKGPDEDVVFVTRGAPPGRSTRSQTFTLPAWGFAQLAVDHAGLAALLRLDRTPGEPVRVRAEAVRRDAALRPVRTGKSVECAVQPGQAIPSCTVISGTSSKEEKASHVLIIEGPPGTTGEISWGPLGTSDVEGYWPAASTREITIGATGTYFVTAPPLPLSQDAEPLACAVDEIDDKGKVVRRVAVDAPSVSWTVPFERSFHSDARSTAIWLRIERGGLYEVRGAPDRKAGCEIFRIDERSRERVGGGSPGDTSGKCGTHALGTGLYEIRFYGGHPGLQTLRVGQVGLGHKASTPAKSSCTFENLALTKGRYRLTTSSDGGATLRGFFARGTPQSLSASLPVIVDPGRGVRVPLAAGAAVIARASPDRTLRCALDDVPVDSARGACVTAPLTAPATLTLQTDDDAPVFALVSRVQPPAPEARPAPWDPAIVKLPVLTAAAPLYFDFARAQSRSVQVQVEKPGLYDLTTEGLLATRCRLRTPTIGKLMEGAQNGRGRNCQIQAYLKPGSYLFTARSEGSSRGRAGLRLAQRAPRNLGNLQVGDELFFRVAAGELAQQTIDLKKLTFVQLEASAQGASLQCRLDDHDGWPLTTVPTACAQSIDLPVGRYVLTALPLTVDSRRRSALLRPPEQVVLQGKKTHPLVINRAYQALLSPSGKDSFTFTIATDLEIGVELDRGMQGRISRVAGGAREIVETVPPVGGGGLAMAGGGAGSDAGSGEGEGEGDEAEWSEDEAEDGFEGDSDGYGEAEAYDADEYTGRHRQRAHQRSVQAARQRAAAEMARRTSLQELPPLAGHVVRLKAGTYILETEHSRGDVAIGYRVRIGARTLAPNVTLSAPVPGRVDVVMPPIAEARAGLLRIKTRGPVDVRCRLRDALGAVVAESGDSGADWNCALAVPLAPGTYSLALEAETLEPGQTELSASFLEAKDTGELKDGDTFRVVAKVAAAPLPAAGPGVVQDVHMTSDGDFSCAAQDEKGAVLERQLSVKSCRFLLWPGEEKRRFFVFVWTPDRAASVKVSMKSRSVRGFGGGNLSADEVGRARIDARGRFTTGAGAMCRRTADGGGILSSCADATSLTAGELLVATPAASRVELKEQVADLDARSAARGIEDRRILRGTRAAERQRSRARALHLVEVRAPFGSRGAPSCALDKGVAAREEATCFAASGPVEESVLSAWTRGDVALEASIVRRAVPWPTSSGVLPPGASNLAWRGESARWSLPNEGYRLKLALPSESWAIVVDGAGNARDVCPPRRAPSIERGGALSSCVLRGRGGDLVLVAEPVAEPVAERVGAPGDARADARADLLTLASVESPRALVALREVRSALAGRDRMVVAAAPEVRELRAEGRGVLACSIHLDNGAHVAGCRARLPAGQGAEIKVEHDERPWRVFAHRPGELMSARYGSMPTGQAPAAVFGTAAALTGNVVQRRVELKQPSALRVQATAGVCAIASGKRILESQGLGGGCDIVRVMPPGSHLVLVRGFGAASLQGNLSVTAEPLLSLDEGVGAEAIVAAGDVRTFRFAVAGDGAVGVGLQTPADTLSCTLLDEKQETVGAGCHQFHRLQRGTYFLRVQAPSEGPPRRFKPVVFGLKGSVVDVPDAWLREFFARIPKAEESR